MKTPLRRAIFTICLTVASLTVSYAQESPETKYRGGNLLVEAGGLTGVEKFRVSGWSVGVVGGYTFDRHFFLGGGFNLNHIMVGNNGGITIPLFARVKYSLLKSKVTPYVSFDAGYDPMFTGISYERSPDYTPEDGDIWLYEMKGGFYWRPEIGVSVRLKKRKAVHVGIGYFPQRGKFLRYEAKGGDISKNRQNSLSVLTFRAGFTF